MISQKFSIISGEQITSFINERESQIEDSLLDSIESVSDLWVLAKMKESYDEENNIHNSVAVNSADVFPAV